MRLITDVLRDIRRGRPVEEATNALADVVRAVDETGKKGSVTITLTISPSKHGGQAVFKQIVMAAGERTGCPVVFGKL